MCDCWHQVWNAFCGLASDWRSSALPRQMVLCRLLLQTCTSGIAHHQSRQGALAEEQRCIPRGDLFSFGQSQDWSQGLSTRLQGDCEGAAIRPVLAVKAIQSGSH